MVAKLIDGKSFAVQIRSEIATQVKALLDSKGIKPGLAVILVGEDPASQVYVRSKGKQTIEVGMNSYEYKLDKHVSEGELLGLIEKLNSDENVNGILCQLPLPDHLNSDLVINSINPEKDVDDDGIRDRRRRTVAALRIVVEHDLNAHTDGTLAKQSVASAGDNVFTNRVTRRDHVTITKLHSLGTLATKLTRDNDFRTLGASLHDVTKHTVARAA